MPLSILIKSEYKVTHKNKLRSNLYMNSDLIPNGFTIEITMF